MEKVENLNFCRLTSKPGSRARKNLEEQLAKTEVLVQLQADTCFQTFGEILGVKGLGGYRKSDYDYAMEKCFGSLNQDGDGSFPLRLKDGLVRSWPVDDDPEEANRMFSLYLARKVFVPVPVKKQEMMLEGFYDTVCTPPTKPVSDGMQAYFKELVRLVFDKPDLDLRDTYFPTHSASCVESSISDGGKRQYFYTPGQSTFDRGKVTPVSIYTGGKVRIITKDSCWNMRYAYLNRFMAGKIRQARWSVFGKPVATWVKENPEFLEGDEAYISGDLESATDLLDSFFADSVLEHLGDLFGLEGHEVEEMKSFTTHARLTDKFHDERQKRGQLMGSILSFPILCLISFCFATYKTRLSEYVLRVNLPAAKRRAAVMRYNKAAVNGDDVVLRDTDRGQRWADNVSDGNGRASRGKSPLAKDMFTINSEIWFRDAEGVWHPPSSIRPSLLAAIGGKKRKNPAQEWLEYSRSELLSQEGKKAFSVWRVLKPHIPTAFGGLGLIHEFDVRTFLEAWICRREIREGTRMIRPAHIWQGHKLPYEGSRKVTVELSVEAAKDVGELLYNTYLPSWTEAVGDPIERASLLATQQYAGITKSEVDWLHQQYDDAMARQSNGTKLMRVPVELSKLFTHVWEGKRLGGCAGTSEAVSRVERELEELEASGWRADPSVRSDFDRAIEARCTWANHYQEEGLEVTKRKDLAAWPVSFGVPVARVAQVVGRDRELIVRWLRSRVAEERSGGVDEPDEIPVITRDVIDAIVLPAGYQMAPFEAPTTWREDKERQEASGYVRGRGEWGE